MKRRGFAVAISVMAGALAAGGAAWLASRLAVPPILADDPGQVALGQSLYAAHCARCHGADLQGQANWQQRRADDRLPAPPLSADGHGWHHPDELLFGIVKRGIGAYAPADYESDMPAFEGVLSDAEIAAVIAFIKSRWPPLIREQQARVNDEWKERGVSP